MQIYSPYGDASHSRTLMGAVKNLSSRGSYKKGTQHGHDQMAGGVDAITMLLKGKPMMARVVCLV